MSVDVTDRLPTLDELEREYFGKQLAALEDRRDRARTAAAVEADWAAEVGKSLRDVHALQNDAAPTRTSRTAREAQTRTAAHPVHARTRR